MTKYYRTKPRLLFLYTELSGYFIACLEKLSELYTVEIHVIHWQVNKEAPFAFSAANPQIKFYERNKFDRISLKEKVAAISPDLIFCSGWMDNEYLRIAHSFKKKIPAVIGIDTQWRGTIRQYIACVLSRVTIIRTFTHCWVPGIRQKKYAAKFGFGEKNILMGSYSANVGIFGKWGQTSLQSKQKKIPHVFIFAGRYHKDKGITNLWDAFCDWQNEQPNDWELWCIGTGAEQPRQNTKIKHFGFVQPDNMAEFIEKGGVFVLPSIFEPWGVVLHEFAAAGFPLICSNAVGAVEVFLDNGKNGYIFTARNVKDLKSCFQKITSLSDTELIEMGNISREKALKITPVMWAKTLMSVFETNKT